ncbi:MAG TPA: inositol monophosphatase family protein [Myxococcota bacterium]|nr:inositol monophosphatase family protein [Myxococcota bacterium]
MDEVARVRALAEQLARAAGAVQRERYETEFAVRTKTASIDLVTEVDHACEELIVGALHRERPADAILAEEGGGSDRPGAEWRWVIDPLDGTMNYAHGYPRFCVSIGVQRRREPFVGVVYDPLLDELFAATRGGGASCNGRPIRVSDTRELGRALLATGFAYDVHRSLDDNLDHFAAFVKRARGLRRDGSAALDLCYVAAGRFDGFWELKLHPWDVAAGNLIVEEASGRTSDFSGRPASGDGRQTVASNGHLHDAIVAILNS